MYIDDLIHSKPLPSISKKCPVCKHIFRLDPDKPLIGVCRECRATHYFSTRKILPLKSVPHSLMPKKCKCANCSCE